MKNSKNLKDIISKSNPDQIMKDFKKVDNMLGNIDLMNENMSESDIKVFEQEAYKIKDELESKYKDHLDYSGDYDKDKEIQKIKNFQNEIKKEMEGFQSDLDSIK
jgi:hypothetical protein